MARSQFPTRKAAPPQHRSILKRERLLRRISRRTLGSVIWVDAPAGYGKTTLMRDCLSVRDDAVVWYRIDEEDSDPAALFFYLRECVQEKVGKAASILPLFTAQYQGNPQRFAREYADLLGSLLPEKSAIVFDDLHMLPTTSPVGTMLAELYANLRTDIDAVVIGRTAPTPHWANVRVTRGIERIEAHDLAFTEDEVIPLGRLLLPDHPWEEDRRLPRRLLEISRGWVTALSLMLKSGLTETEDGPDYDSDDTIGQIFEYYATSLFDGLDTRVQHLLLLTAQPPGFSVALASELLHDPQTADLIDQLYRNNYFLEKSAGKPVMYRYHPLFREYLLSVADLRLDGAEIDHVLQLAGTHFQKQGESDLAVQCFAQIEDPLPYARAIETQAQSLFEKGRWQTLLQWLDNVADETREEHPWLSYWYGMCLRQTDTVAAQSALEIAYHLFQASRQVEGQFLAWAGVVETIIFRFGGFTELSYWIDEMGRLRTGNPLKASLKTRLRCEVILFTALLLHQPTNQLLPKLQKKLQRLLIFAPSAENKLLIGAHLMRKHIYMGDLSAAELLYERLSPIASRQAFDPFTNMVWFSTKAMFSWVVRSPEEGLRAAEEGLAYGARFGIHLMDVTLLIQGAFSAFLAGDWRLAATYVERMPASIKEEQSIFYANYLFMRGWLDINQGHYREARERMVQAGEIIELSETPFQQCIHQWGVGMSLAQCGQFEEGVKATQDGIDLARECGFHMLRYMLELTLAQIRIDQRDEAGALDILRSALLLGRSQRYFNTVHWSHPSLSRIFALALSHAIETDFVMTVIQRVGLKPLGAACLEPQWPWPVRIRTLGGLRIETNGKPLELGKKVPKQPLNLLKLLAIHRGQSLNAEEVGESLWPDIPPENQPATLKTTLSRLRKLIGKECVQFREGRMQINSELVWVDVRTLEQLINQSRTPPDDGGNLKALWARLRATYSGILLPEDDWYWVLGARERLHVGFSRALQRIVDQALMLRLTDLAVDAALYGLEVDPLAEGFYRALMRAHISMGEHGEAVRIYRRCQQILSSRLAIEPAAETKALYHSISAAE